MLNQEQLAFLAEILPCWKAMDREHQRLLERTMTERSVKGASTCIKETGTAPAFSGCGMVRQECF